MLSYRWTQGARIRGEQDAGWTRCRTDDCLRAWNGGRKLDGKIDAVESTMWERSNDVGPTHPERVEPIVTAVSQQGHSSITTLRKRTSAL